MGSEMCIRDSVKGDEEVDFIEVEYDKVDELLAMQEPKSPDVQFTPIKMEEFCLLYTSDAADEEEYEVPTFADHVKDVEEVDFIEVEYDKVDELLAMQEPKSPDVQFTPIKMEELVTANSQTSFAPIYTVVLTRGWRASLFAWTKTDS